MKLHDLTIFEIQNMLLSIGIQKWQLPYCGLVPKQNWDRMTCIEELARFLQENTSTVGSDQTKLVL